MTHVFECCAAMAIWGVSHDPILNRYAIGGLARLVASSDGGWKSVAQALYFGGQVSGLHKKMWLSGSNNSSCIVAGGSRKLEFFCFTQSSWIANSYLTDVSVVYAELPIWLP